ncbi:serine protease [Methylobacterium radiodurans]|uniref:Serine protease n=2 Tax=Methylobacterium radiodurans TaxID=2202828 RepID=A0A2U8VZ90_9HYPH|nr:serine protease [Methylobacterium radiodurans]
MTSWWIRVSAQIGPLDAFHDRLFRGTEYDDEIAAAVSRTGQWEFFRFAALAATVSLREDPATVRTDLAPIEEILAGGRPGRRRPTLLAAQPIIARFVEMARAMHPYGAGVDAGGEGTGQEPRIWTINRNREASVSVGVSRRTVKADAAHCVFNLDTTGIRWGIVDDGVDARHPAFRDRKRLETERVRDPAFDPEAGWAAVTRVSETYDFTFLRRLIATGRIPRSESGGWPDRLQASAETRRFRRQIEAMRRRYDDGGDLDWTTIQTIIRVPHGPGYRPPASAHGTHVAGILAADWPQEENPERDIDVRGICPALELYDLRVFGDDGAGGDEFTIQAALEFVGFLNKNRRLPVIHGVNLSLSIPHEVESFACGRTPVCEECNRLSGQGVVVVAAAGNRGWVTGRADDHFGDFRSITVTDPGNAREVITVGSTHRIEPHTYGVSFFSSRGPTGDGRIKPDLVAPGEKILGPTPGGGLRRLDGTSMAAPHVSGAAALLMARHRELIGDPRRIKEVLCRTCTDLGRERYFQGAGLVDVLRALQSI